MKLCLDLFLDPVSPINNGDKSIGEFFAWNFVYFDVSKNSLRSVYQGLLLYFMLIFFSLFSMHLQQQLLCPKFPLTISELSPNQYGVLFSPIAIVRKLNCSLP